jgi:DNA-directed RNA polymerase subunit RPC12/RpoP
MRVNINDFLDEHNRVNWSAYRQAMRTTGETCSHCDGFISRPTGKPTVCAVCAADGKCIQLESGLQVQSTQWIRCPHCGHRFDPTNTELHQVYSEGQHEIWCVNCDQDFTVETQITRVYVSPAQAQG